MLARCHAEVESAVKLLSAGYGRLAADSRARQLVVHDGIAMPFGVPSEDSAPPPTAGQQSSKGKDRKGKGKAKP